MGARNRAQGRTHAPEQQAFETPRHRQRIKHALPHARVLTVALVLHERWAAFRCHERQQLAAWLQRVARPRRAAWLVLATVAAPNRHGGAMDALRRRFPRRGCHARSKRSRDHWLSGTGGRLRETLAAQAGAAVHDNTYVII